MKMRSGLFAVLVFAIVASGCSSSASVPEETQNETQEPQKSAKKMFKMPQKSLEETETTRWTEEEDRSSEQEEEPNSVGYTPKLEDKIVMSLNQWLEENGAPGSAVSVLLP